MSPARRPSSSSCAQPVGDQARLGAPPGLVSALRQPEPRCELVPPLRAGDEQLDGRLALRRADVEEPQRAVLVDAQLLATGAQRREALAELGPEGRVEHVQQLLAAAEVDRQPAHLTRVELVRPAAEDVHVGVPEAVDRLELVADREQVVALERPQDAELDRVRVLELVDHDQLEALGPACAGRLVVEEVAGAQLEVVEVDRRAPGLGVVVGRAVAVEQRVDEGEGAAGVEVRAGGAIGGERGAVRLAGVRGERLGAALELGGVERARPRHAAPLPGRHSAARPRPPPRRAARRRAPAPLGRPSRARRRPPSPGRAARPLSSPPGRSGRARGAAGGSRAAGGRGRGRAGSSRRPARGRAAPGRTRRPGRSPRRRGGAPRAPARPRTRPRPAARRRSPRAPRSAGPGRPPAAGRAAGARRSRGWCRSRRRRRRARARPRPARSGAAAAARRARPRPSR